MIAVSEGSDETGGSAPGGSFSAPADGAGDERRIRRHALATPRHRSPRRQYVRLQSGTLHTVIHHRADRKLSDTIHAFISPR